MPHRIVIIKYLRASKEINTLMRSWVGDRDCEYLGRELVHTEAEECEWSRALGASISNLRWFEDEFTLRR